MIAFFIKALFSYIIILGFGRAKVEKVEVGLICFQIGGFLKSSAAMMTKVK
jgi:hypothetical protein